MVQPPYTLFASLFVSLRSLEETYTVCSEVIGQKYSQFNIDRDASSSFSTGLRGSKISVLRYIWCAHAVPRHHP